MNSMMPAYDAFLRGKIQLAPLYGFECAADEINPLLKPHQRDIVHWVVRGGSRAIFAAFGLGKTFMQIESVRLLRVRAGPLPRKRWRRSTPAASPSCAPSSSRGSRRAA